MQVHAFTYLVLPSLFWVQRVPVLFMATQRRSYTGKDGVERVYESFLSQRSFQEGGNVRNQTLANLSALPPEAIAAVKAVLQGETLVATAAAVVVERSRPHGHLAAAAVTAKRPGLGGLLGVPGPGYGDGVEAGRISWWSDTTLGPDFDIADVHTDVVYRAMDWLVERQTRSRNGWRRRIWTGG